MTDLKIRKLEESDFDAFAQLVGLCFREDYKLELNDAQVNEVSKTMTQQAKNDIAHTDLLCVDGIAIGFIQYQIDSPKSDWCEKEGWGCIREMYISNEYRKKGYGKTLATHAENELKKLLAAHIYLTTDDALDFWLNVGYVDSGEICEKNDGNILVKQA